MGPPNLKLEDLTKPEVLLQLAIAFAIPSIIAALAANQHRVLLFLHKVWRWFNGETIRTVSFTHSTDYWFNCLQDDRNNILQKAIMMHFGKNKTTVPKLKLGEFRLLMADESKETKGVGWQDQRSGVRGSEALAAMRVTAVPAKREWQEVEPGIWFHYDEVNDENAPASDNRTIHYYNIASYGRNGKKKIDDFLDRVYNGFIDELKKEQDKARYLYQMQIRDTLSSEDLKKPPVYKKYALTEDKTFDSLFFEGKSDILALIDDFCEKRGKFAIEGFPNKLGLLIHGPPGTGKTSFVKALAQHTNRHIVTVPLAKIKTNQQLYDILFDLVFPTPDDEGVSTQMAFDDIIFLMEDIDASADIVKSRAADAKAKANDPLLKLEEMMMKQALAASKAGTGTQSGGVGTSDAAADAAAGFDVPTATDWSKKYDTADQLDLAGLLNVLDGVVDSPGRIVIMTTNHPQSLDAALIRPGRINTKLHMDYMTDSDVEQMLRHHFPGNGVDKHAKALRTMLSKKRSSTPNFNISGAEVEQLCAECDEPEEFVSELMAYPRLHRDLRA